MAQALPVIMAAQAVYSGYTGYKNAKAEQESARADAREAYAAAQRARDAGRDREVQSRREGRQVMGTLRAALGQTGTGYGGTAMDIMRQSATDAEYDAMMARYEGLVEARGYEAEAYGQEARADSAKFAARSAIFGAVLGTAGAVGGAYAGAKTRKTESELRTLQMDYYGTRLRNAGPRIGRP